MTRVCLSPLPRFKCSMLKETDSRDMNDDSEEEQEDSISLELDAEPPVSTTTTDEYILVDEESLEIEVPAGAPPVAAVHQPGTDLFPSEMEPHPLLSWMLFEDSALLQMGPIGAFEDIRSEEVLPKYEIREKPSQVEAPMESLPINSMDEEEFFKQEEGEEEDAQETLLIVDTLVTNQTISTVEHTLTVPYSSEAEVLFLAAALADEEQEEALFKTLGDSVHTSIAQEEEKMDIISMQEDLTASIEEAVGTDITQLGYLEEVPAIASEFEQVSEKLAGSMETLAQQSTLTLDKGQDVFESISASHDPTTQEELNAESIVAIKEDDIALRLVKTLLEEVVASLKHTEIVKEVAPVKVTVPLHSVETTVEEFAETITIQDQVTALEEVPLDHTAIDATIPSEETLLAERCHVHESTEESTVSVHMTEAVVAVDETVAITTPIIEDIVEEQLDRQALAEQQLAGSELRVFEEPIVLESEELVEALKSIVAVETPTEPAEVVVLATDVIVHIPIEKEVEAPFAVVQDITEPEQRLGEESDAGLVLTEALQVPVSEVSENTKAVISVDEIVKSDIETEAVPVATFEPVRETEPAVEEEILRSESIDTLVDREDAPRGTFSEIKLVSVQGEEPVNAQEPTEAFETFASRGGPVTIAEEIFDSIITPGLSGRVLSMMHVSFFALILTLVVLLILTHSMHVVFLLVVNGALWGAVSMFINDINSRTDIAREHEDAVQTKKDE